MAITAKSEEIVVQVARAIGAIHEAINDGIGDESMPGTALFEVDNLGQLAQRRLPHFGVLENTPDSFVCTYNTDDPYFIVVGPGQVGYKGSRISVLAQRVPIKKTFGQTYPNTYQYGIRLGFPLSEAKRATKSWSTSVSQDANQGDSLLYVSDTAVVKELGFPLQAHIGSLFVIFSGLNASEDALIIDPGFYNGSEYGKLASAVYKDAPVRFIYEPRVRAVCGFPQAGVGNDPSDFLYFPPLPRDWLPVADVLITNPGNPVVAGSAPNWAILRTVISWPSSTSAEPLFESKDAALIMGACQSTRQTLRSIRNSAKTAGLIQALNSYTAKKAGNQSTTFRQFWGNQPFRPTSYFGVGLSFAGLERVDFPASFARAYYDITGEDIQHTFGMFRGDLVSQTNAVVANAQVTGLAVKSVKAQSTPSSLTRGTYVYGVSAVLPTGETPPVYATTVASDEGPTYFLNEVGWNSVSGAIFYHIYRRANLEGDLTEYRLTAPEQITGVGKFTNTPATIAQYDTVSISHMAVKVIPLNGSYLGGASLMLSCSALLTNPGEKLQISLHSDSGGSPGLKIADGTDIPFSALAVSPKEFTVAFTDASTSLPGVNVTPGSTYWIQIERSAAPTGGDIKVGVATSGTNQLYTSSNGSSWTPSSNRTVYFVLRGFVDDGLTATYPLQRGVRLTGRVSMEPRRLSLFVPEISELPSQSGLPRYGGDGDPLVSTTESSVTKNEMIVTVVARKGLKGDPVTLTATIPQGTPRGRRFALGTASQLFDRVDDLQVKPGSSITTTTNGQINWSVYDFFTLETVP